MKVVELLLEIGNTRHSLEVTTSSNNFTASTDMDGREAQFNAKLATTKYDKSKPPVKAWDVEFSKEDDDGEQSLILTGTGDEFKMMSFVNQSLKLFLAKKNPRVITFSANKMESAARTKAYKKLFAKVMPKAKMTTYQTDDEYETTVIEL